MTRKAKVSIGILGLLAALLLAAPLYAQTTTAPQITPAAPAQPNNSTTAPALAAPGTLSSGVSPNAILPPLYGWPRVAIKDLRMPANQFTSKECGMQQEMIFHFFMDELAQQGVPVMVKAQADKLIPEPITVVAEPVIVTLEDLVINCMSWIQFTVTADYTYRVPPLMNRRKMTQLLWQDGMIVSSAKSTHNGALITKFREIADRFAADWKKAQAGTATPVSP